MRMNFPDLQSNEREVCKETDERERDKTIDLICGNAIKLLIAAMDIFQVGKQTIITNSLKRWNASRRKNRTRIRFANFAPRAVQLSNA